MAGKNTELSITLRTIDQATAGIRAVNAQLAAVTKPARDFKEALSDLRSKSGLDDVLGGFKGVGSAIGDVLSKVAMIGGVVGVAVAGLFKLVGEFDDLGDKAEAIGVSVDYLAGMRYAAEQSGAAVEKLDSGLQSFTTSLGQARAGTGPMTAFLNLVSPALLTQIKAAKSNAEAFDLLAAAAAKIEDPAKRAAFAQKTLGDASLAPLLARGAKGIKELRDEHDKHSGSLEGAAAASGKVDNALKNLKASTDGIKAALLEGLAPALEVIVKQLGEWFDKHRGDVKEWAASLGKKLPAAFNAVVGAIGSAVDAIKPFVDSGTKLKVLLGVIAAVILGPVISAVVSLGVALLTTPVGWIVAGIAAIAAGAYLLIDNWDAVSGFFVDLWDTVKAKFGWATDLIMTAVAPFIAVPLMVIEHWGGIKDFFVSLWDGITSVFEKAWEIIGGIVDKVKSAVDFVSDAIDSINPFSGGGSSMFDMANRMMNPNAPTTSDVLAQTMGTIGAARGQATQAKVTVDFANAPRGTRVSADPKSTADVDVSVGYQWFGP